MAALASLSDVVNRLTGGNSGTPEHTPFYIDNRIGSGAATAPVAGRMSSFWLWNKHPGGAGAAPSSSAIPVNDTTGALFQTDPGGGRTKYLLGAAVAPTQSGAYLLYDRLVHTGGLSGTVTTEQTTNLPTTTLTRGLSYTGNLIFLEIYSAIGATSRTVTVRYTNQAGTGSRTTKAVAIGNSGLQESERIIVCPLQDGDTGVKSVEGVTLSASTGTAGNFGVTIARPLLWLPVGGSGSGAVRDCISGFPSIPQIETDACLAMAYQATGTTAPQIHGEMHFIEA